MNEQSRREFLKKLGFLGALAPVISVLNGCGGTGGLSKSKQNRPNIILCMADDHGWGDTGYNGHSFIHTPNLDRMAKEGIVFNRFYSGAPVCSPTRGSCITGRHPYRYGVFSANVGHMPKEEITLAETLKTSGYTTGHFGKWHLGILTKSEIESNRGGREKQAEHYSPPWDNGFDVCFSTEAKVPTYDPMVTPQGRKGNNPNAGKPYGTYYWVGPGNKETENLQGDDSRIIMDRVIPFIENAVKEKKPFFAVVWFHAPHLPVVAGAEHRAIYKDLTEYDQHYFGCITAMDEQVGRLRNELSKLGIEKNTMLWYCSDNGPERGTPGSTGPFRERKRSLYEGGVRVPGLLVWPQKIKTSRSVDIPCSTSDYFPTILDVLGFQMKGQPEPIDGTSLMPLIEGKMKQRVKPIGFESQEWRIGKKFSLVDDRYKLITNDDGQTYELYDLINDMSETKNIASQKPAIVKVMKQTLERWRASCKRSLAGVDYK